MFTMLSRLLLGVIYALVLAEMFVRFFDPQPLLPRYVTASSYGVRMNVPNSTYQHSTEEVLVTMRTNGQGLRADHDIAYEKPNELCRVLLLGDSYMMGYEIEYKHSAAFLLEKLLQQAGLNCEIVNMAVSGFGSAEMLVALTDEGFKYSPDYVIFAFHRGDLKENLQSRLYKVKDGVLLRDRTAYLPAIHIRDLLSQYAIYRWVIENSHLYSAVREFAATSVKRMLSKSPFSGRDQEKTVGTSPGLSAEPSYEVTLAEALIGHAAELTRKKDACFLLLDVPLRLNKSTHESKSSMVGVAWNGQTISPITMFNKAHASEMQLYREKGHSHWNELGNRLVAREIAKKVIALEGNAKCSQNLLISSETE